MPREGRRGSVNLLSRAVATMSLPSQQRGRSDSEGCAVMAIPPHSSRRRAPQRGALDSQSPCTRETEQPPPSRLWLLSPTPVPWSPRPSWCPRPRLPLSTPWLSPVSAHLLVAVLLFSSWPVVDGLCLALSSSLVSIAFVCALHFVPLRFQWQTLTSPHHHSATKVFSMRQSAT